MSDGAGAAGAGPGASAYPSLRQAAALPLPAKAHGVQRVKAIAPWVQAQIRGLSRKGKVGGVNIGEYDSEKDAAIAFDVARVWQIEKGQLGYTWQAPGLNFPAAGYRDDKVLLSVLGRLESLQDAKDYIKTHLVVAPPLTPELRHQLAVKNFGEGALQPGQRRVVSSAARSLREGCVLLNLTEANFKSRRLNFKEWMAAHMETWGSNSSAGGEPAAPAVASKGGGQSSGKPSPGRSESKAGGGTAGGKPAEVQAGVEGQAEGQAGAEEQPAGRQAYAQTAQHVAGGGRVSAMWKDRPLPAPLLLWSPSEKKEYSVGFTSAGKDDFAFKWKELEPLLLHLQAAPGDTLVLFAAPPNSSTSGSGSRLPSSGGGGASHSSSGFVRAHVRLEKGGQQHRLHPEQQRSQQGPGQPARQQLQEVREQDKEEEEQEGEEGVVRMRGGKAEGNDAARGRAAEQAPSGSRKRSAGTAAAAAATAAGNSGAKKKKRKRKKEEEADGARIAAQAPQSHTLGAPAAAAAEPAVPAAGARWSKGGEAQVASLTPQPGALIASARQQKRKQVQPCRKPAQQPAAALPAAAAAPGAAADTGSGDAAAAAAAGSGLDSADVFSDPPAGRPQKRQRRQQDAQLQEPPQQEEQQQQQKQQPSERRQQQPKKKEKKSQGQQGQPLNSPVLQQRLLPGRPAGEEPGQQRRQQQQQQQVPSAQQQQVPSAQQQQVPSAQQQQMPSVQRQQMPSVQRQQAQHDWKQRQAQQEQGAVHQLHQQVGHEKQAQAKRRRQQQSQRGGRPPGRLVEPPCQLPVPPTPHHSWQQQELAVQSLEVSEGDATGGGPTRGVAAGPPPAPPTRQHKKLPASGLGAAAAAAEVDAWIAAEEAAIEAEQAAAGAAGTPVGASQGFQAQAAVPSDGTAPSGPATRPPRSRLQSKLEKLLRGPRQGAAPASIVDIGSGSGSGRHGAAATPGGSAAGVAAGPQQQQRAAGAPGAQQRLQQQAPAQQARATAQQVPQAAHPPAAPGQHQPWEGQGCTADGQGPDVVDLTGQDGDEDDGQELFIS